MSHYSEQYEEFYQDAISWNTELNVEHPIKATKRPPVIQYKSWDGASIPAPVASNVEDKIPGKDMTGKSAGARFCFLQDVASSFGVNYFSSLGFSLHTATTCIEENQFEAAKTVLAAAAKRIAAERPEMLSEMIKIRADILEAGKYSINSYKSFIPLEALLDAAARHYIKLVAGIETDEESGCHHLGHILANIVIINKQIDLQKPVIEEL